MVVGTPKQRSYQISYVVKIGAGNETRTRDFHLGKVVLYQLSYSRFAYALSDAYAAGLGF